MNVKNLNLTYALPVLFGLLFTINVYAQKGKSDFIESLSSENEFESIPHYLKLRSALATLSGDSEHSPLSNEDSIVAIEASITKSSLDRTFDIFTDACSWLDDQLAAGNMIDASYIANQQTLAEEIEEEDVTSQFYGAYDRLSADGKSKVDEEILQMRGENRLVIMKFDFEGYAKFAPQNVISQFASYCGKLNRAITEHNNLD